eukprot:GAHX01002999.1.p1 GENE.GAHX01002999.1~~GAHX01002999.1.p1  ORF type:complete len:285 (-),score=76.16 GAHX01002999.1:47-901(-)
MEEFSNDKRYIKIKELEDTDGIIGNKEQIDIKFEYFLDLYKRQIGENNETNTQIKNRLFIDGSLFKFLQNTKSLSNENKNNTYKNIEFKTSIKSRSFPNHKKPSKANTRYKNKTKHNHPKDINNCDLTTGNKETPKENNDDHVIPKLTHRKSMSCLDEFEKTTNDDTCYVNENDNENTVQIDSLAIDCSKGESTNNGHQMSLDSFDRKCNFDLSDYEKKTEVKEQNKEEKKKDSNVLFASLLVISVLCLGIGSAFISKWFCVKYKTEDNTDTTSDENTEVETEE